jgi:transmembrane protein EpsG
VFGLRYGVGIDYFAYEDYFINQYDTFRMEYAYSLINYFLHNIGLPFYSVTLFISFFTNYLVLIGSWFFGLRGVYLSLSILIYMSNVMLIGLNGMRQVVAVAIVYLAFVFLVRNKRSKFILGCLSASLFHLSSLGMFFILFLRPYLSSRFSVIFLFLLLNLIFFYVLFFDLSDLLYNITIHIPYYSKYSTLVIDAKASGVGFGVLLRFIFSFVFIFCYIVISKSNSKVDRLFVSLYLLGLILNFISTTNFLWGRVGLYFYIFEIIAIPLMIRSFKSKDMRVILFLFAVGYSFTFIVASLFFNTEITNLSYKSVITKF